MPDSRDSPKRGDPELTPQPTTRRSFLKMSALAGVGATLAGLPKGPPAAAQPAPAVGDDVALPDLGHAPPRPAGQQPVHTLTTKPRERVRVAFIGLKRGLTLLQDAIKTGFAEVVAVCDIVDERAQKAAAVCEQRGGERPAIYSGNDSIWERVAERDDIDAIYIATPWNWHVAMAIRTMERGKHALLEVAAAVSVADCWSLVDTSERTQRHCVMLENCCYGENELLVLNLVRQGMFGTLTHAECAYVHDLRRVLFELGGEGDWRRNYHWQLDGNLYPTHGLGPVAQYLGIGRGDQFKFLVSMSSPEAGLTKYRDERQPNGGRHARETYRCGDMNTSLIKTELGRTIMVQHDVVSPRPYSRINALTGTGGTFFDYPARLALNEPKRYGLEASGSHEWLSPADMAVMRQQFTHPLWRQLSGRAKGGGHGGMDFVMNWRLLDCLRKGLTPDSVVYDAAAWSCIIELSVRSVATGSRPVRIPDFTRGLWPTMQPLAIADPHGG